MTLPAIGLHSDAVACGFDGCHDGRAHPVDHELGEGLLGRAASKGRWETASRVVRSPKAPRAARPALVTRVDLLRRKGGEVGSTNDVMGPPAGAIRRRLLDVQYGRAVVIQRWMSTVH